MARAVFGAIIEGSTEALTGNFINKRLRKKGKAPSPFTFDDQSLANHKSMEVIPFGKNELGKGNNHGIGAVKGKSKFSKFSKFAVPSMAAGFGIYNVVKNNQQDKFLRGMESQIQNMNFDQGHNLPSYMSI